MTRPALAQLGRLAAAVTGRPTVGDPGIGVFVSAWRALAVFRALTLLYAVIVNLADIRQVVHPRWCLATLAVMTLWTGFASFAYTKPAWRSSRWLPALDMAVTVVTILATLMVETEERIATGELTVPTVWGAAAPLAWAIRWRLAGGMLGATMIAAANFIVDRGQPTRATVHSLILVFLAGAVIGYVIRIAERAERALAEAIRLQGATAERERLSREIHDGVLQVLALVRRRGTELGGDAELGRLATDQEAALRALISAGPRLERADGLADLRALLADPARRPNVHLASPATPVLLPADVAQQLAAAVGEALHNVKHHVGADADAWILVESTPDEVVVTVRDDGPGIPPDRLAEAASAGRLGVAQSIVGRLRDLGGKAVINSAPGEGTEVELHVPR